MRAVYAESINSKDPLSGLVVGERPEPQAPEGWARVTVKAAALNHHDVWSLRGQGLKAEALPMILGCDAAGVDEEGNECPIAEFDDEGGLTNAGEAIGEICNLTGAKLFEGYYRNPEATAERNRGDVYHSGDLEAQHTDVALTSLIATMETFQRIYRPEIYHATTPAGTTFRPSLENPDHTVPPISYDRVERTDLAREQGRYAEEHLMTPHADLLRQWAAAAPSTDREDAR